MNRIEKKDLSQEGSHGITKFDELIQKAVLWLFQLIKIDPKEEILARKDTGNELYVINNPVYKKYVFKAEFKK